MRIRVTVRPNAKMSFITKTGQMEYRVSVKAPAEDNKANEELLQLLSEYFLVPRMLIRIVQGRTSRNKLIELPGKGPGD